MQKVFVVVLNYNGFTDSSECIVSLLKSNYKNFEIVIVDNGSSDESISYFKTHFKDITLIENNSNLGYAGGNNVGISYALNHGADFVLVLNNDTIVDPNCISSFVQESKNHPNSILGGKVFYYDEKEVMQHFGGVWSKKKGKFINVPNPNFNANQPANLDFVTGCALFVPREIFKSVGLFEHSFFLYYEEIDFCYRAKKNGFYSTFVPTPIIYHKESRSFTHPKPPQSYFQWRNRLYFIERNFSRKALVFWLLIHLPKRAIVIALKKWLTSLSIIIFGSSEKKEISKLAYSASLKGMYDYFARSFGKGPDWIFQTQKIKKKRS